jgi:hypothetical protein
MPLICNTVERVARLGMLAAVLAGWAGVLVAAPPAPGPMQAAHYRLSWVPSAGATPEAAAPTQDWYVSRLAGELRLRKGDMEEVWQRDAAGRISFLRIFHADRKVVSYSDGELRTLGLAPDWDALASLADGAAQGRHPGPLGVLSLDLVEQRSAWPASWPALDEDRIGNYERLDAADLGDMEYDAFARKAEALDLRAGWRSAHAH